MMVHTGVALLEPKTVEDLIYIFRRSLEVHSCDSTRRKNDSINKRSQWDHPKGENEREKVEKKKKKYTISFDYL